jgi:Protein of unknown function (DUF3551)
MPKPILAFFLVAAALLGETQLVQAQTSASAYPWCALYSPSVSSGFRSCYYSSWAQCMETLSGIGGLCVQSPYFHAPSATPSKPGEGMLRHRRRL